MKKVKLTKNELKKQKDSLKRFNRYLPTLYIKKQQLQKEIGKVRQELEQVEGEYRQKHTEFSQWICLLAGDFQVGELIQIGTMQTTVDNIAGIDINRFKELEMAYQTVDVLETPIWIDHYIERARSLFTLEANRLVLRDQEKRLLKELRETAQRVNLFEKIKIPEALEIIKKIRIYLGDQQTASVGWARLAKKKIAEQE